MRSRRPLISKCASESITNQRNFDNSIFECADVYDADPAPSQARPSAGTVRVRLKSALSVNKKIKQICVGDTCLDRTKCTMLGMERIDNRIVTGFP